MTYLVVCESVNTFVNTRNTSKEFFRKRGHEILVVYCYIELILNYFLVLPCMSISLIVCTRNMAF
jgi:hypothetical protein